MAVPWVCLRFVIVVFPDHTHLLFFSKGREEIAGSLQEFWNRWCKWEYAESNALNTWKLNKKNIDSRITFYCINLVLFPPKPTFTFRNLKKGVQEFKGSLF